MSQNVENMAATYAMAVRTQLMGTGQREGSSNTIETGRSMTVEELEKEPCDFIKWGVETAVRDYPKTKRIRRVRPEAIEKRRRGDNGEQIVEPERKGIEVATPEPRKILHGKKKTDVISTYDEDKLEQQSKRESKSDAMNYDKSLPYRLKAGNNRFRIIGVVDREHGKEFLIHKDHNRKLRFTVQREELEVNPEYYSQTTKQTVTLRPGQQSRGTQAHRGNDNFVETREMGTTTDVEALKSAGMIGEMMKDDGVDINSDIIEKVLAGSPSDALNVLWDLAAENTRLRADVTLLTDQKNQSERINKEQIEEMAMMTRDNERLTDMIKVLRKSQALLTGTNEHLKLIQEGFDGKIRDAEEKVKIFMTSHLTDQNMFKRIQQIFSYYENRRKVARSCLLSLGKEHPEFFRHAAPIYLNAIHDSLLAPLETLPWGFTHVPAFDPVTGIWKRGCRGLHAKGIAEGAWKPADIHDCPLVGQFLINHKWDENPTIPKQQPPWTNKKFIGVRK